MCEFKFPQDKHKHSVYWYIQDSYCQKLTCELNKTLTALAQTMKPSSCYFYYPHSIGEIHSPQFNE